VLLLVGQMVGFGLSFLRNLILARILTKADFGLAAALSLTMSLLELVSRMSFGLQIIQAPEGDDPIFQAVAHSAQMAVGVISAVLVLVGAYPFAIAFSVPNLTWAFVSLAIVPLTRGAMHLDMARLQRSYLYGSAVLCDVVPQGLATATAWPLALWLGDFRVVLWIMLGKEIATVALSHLLADRQYHCAWQRTTGIQMLSFGWPLLLNSFVMFASLQADQILIGANFSLADLGSYSIAFTITSIPFFIFGQVGSSLMLPIMARQEDSVQYERQYSHCLELSVLGSLFFLGPLVVAGGSIVRLLYGPKYSGIGWLMTVFGIIVALRLFRLAPSVASMARADTINELICNIARSASLPIALLVVAIGVNKMEAVAACGLAGEALAILISSLRIHKRQKINLAVHIRPLLFLLGWIALGVVMRMWSGCAPPIWVPAVETLVLWCMGAIASFYLFPEMRSIYRQLFESLSLK